MNVRAMTPFHPLLTTPDRRGATSLLLAVALVWASLFCGGPGAQGDDLVRLQQLAVQQAVAAADPSIVRIETVGGVDLVGDILTSTGPTTGVVVREDGYIITSRFNFLANPTSVVVTLADERQFAAEIVSSDMSRMLTLLKINATDLTPLTPVPKEEFRVGQWAVALGRTFDLKFPNISVGIISALNRVWGKAIQTDAKTSPLNYGGALIDLSGRCLGVIVPLSPQEQGETAGVEWYDSGIGFAVPYDDILKVLPKLIAGETLKPGLLGVGFEDNGPVSGEAKIIRVRPESPADQAGLKEDDVITQINGHPVQKLNDLKHVLGSLYAKDTVQLAIRRGEETLTREITLTDVLKAYQFPYLGVWPDRNDSDSNGVRLHRVYPESPAAQVGLKAGDIIQKVKDDSVSSAAELAERIRRVEVGNDVELSVLRDGETLALKATLVPFPNDPPEAGARQRYPLPETPPSAKTGRLNEQLPEEGLSFWGFVPENYRPDRKWGLLIWLHPPGDTEEAHALQAWADECRDRGVILVGPRAGDVGGWSAEQEPQVMNVVEWIRERYTLDPARVVVVGKEASGPFATRFAFKYRDLVRGLVLIGAPLRIPPPDTDPDAPLQFAFVSASKGAPRKLIDSVVEALRKRNFPTWLLEQSEQDETTFPPDTVTELSEWIDALDRL